MKNRIDDLRNHLFAAIEALADDENPMEIDRARAISEVAQTIINSAKVQVDFLKVVGGQRSPEFLSAPAIEAQPTESARRRMLNGGAS